MIESIEPWMWGVLSYILMGLLFSEMYRRYSEQKKEPDFNRATYLMGMVFWPVVLVIGMYSGGKK